ncbi:hypothetical protein D5086_013905 [Populus alba]|uniref:Uncharacterized protein n=1 Tax=Populus alba TaxID=43335 RepID=A0ACC4C6Y4_POPAL
MGETRDNDTYEEELLDYEEEDEKAPDSVGAKVNGEAVKKGYVGIHSSGFRDFLLKPELLRSIVDSGFEHPSEVQHECIPQAILGMDVICQAKSGMGKTAVFVLSTLQQIEPTSGQVIALVLCHTRELAYQICHEFERFSTYLPDTKVAVFYGGVNIKTHKDLLKNECPHIVVGTPGRILALARDKDLSLKNVRHFILDECDKMLESLDMRRDVQEIFKMTPHDKQVMMFSATLSKEIRPVCKKFMQDPMEIYVDDEAKLTLHGLVQHYIKLTELEKNRKLNDLLDALDFNQVVIFVKSVSRAAELNKLLVECNFPSICIHSGMSQEERLMRYKGFKEGHKRILVATDLVGRGIDIERVNIVINYDMPDSADTYLHRVGRAGRFGTKGLAITFVSSASDSDVLNQVQERFEVDIKELPEQIDTSTYSTLGLFKGMASSAWRSWSSWGINIFIEAREIPGSLQLQKYYSPGKKLAAYWIGVGGVANLNMHGSRTIDGQGSARWLNKQANNLDVQFAKSFLALLFNNNSNLKLSGLNVVNSPRSHVSLNDCKGVSISGLKITAPGNSPNTDGIDVSSSSHVSIVDSTIGTGDDCIAIKGGCSNINITGINCGPGHGISIGSIGENGATERVEEVHVRNCNFTGTENGARIKTVPGGSGYVRRITFEQITLNAAGSPIIIDQRYCDGKKKGCPDQPKAVAVSDVTFTGFRGTSSDEQVITLDCAAIGCNNIRMVQVTITSSVAGKRRTAFCSHAHGTAVSTAPPVPCLSGRAFAWKFLTD